MVIERIDMKRRRCWTYGFNTRTIIHDKEIEDDTDELKLGLIISLLCVLIHAIHL